MQYPPQKQFLEALLLSRGFESSSHLAKSLLAFTDAFNNPINFTGEKELLRKLQTSHLKVVVALAQQHMSEFESLGVLQQQGPLQIPSGVYSEFSGCTRFSVHFKPTFLHPEEGKVGAVQRSSLEEFALVLALKDTVLPSLPPGSSEHSLAVGLLTDTYPNCDVPGLLAHEKAIREALTARSARDSEAAESARESRAASAMQVVAEEQLSEGTCMCSDRGMLGVGSDLCFPCAVTSTFEEHIVHCCHLRHLSPTPQFQMAVTQVSSSSLILSTFHFYFSLRQLLTQLHSHSIVAVSGPSCSGKSAAIQVALEATRELIGGATCVTVACNALTEGELMGFYSNRSGYSLGTHLHMHPMPHPEHTTVCGKMAYCLSSLQWVVDRQTQNLQNQQASGSFWRDRYVFQGELESKHVMTTLFLRSAHQLTGGLLAVPPSPKPSPPAAQWW